jgi:CRP-like cAMP-binding protein/CheY-like chemotaxis protein
MVKLLVIDDHDSIRENVVEILTLANYHVTAAENGRRGIELAINEKPDLIICDITMPGLDGYEVLEQLRKNDDTAFVPFIFLSAKTERSDLRKGMDMGADDYITKPFDDVDLLNAVKTRLEKYKVLHKRYPGVKGPDELLKELYSSGFLDIALNKYNAEVFTKKQKLYTEGKTPRYLYYLQSGKIKTYLINEDGKEYITNLYTSGDFIGYLSILEDKLYEEAAEVLEDAEVLQIPKDDFLEAIYNDVNIAAKFIKLITHNLQDKEQRLMNLAYGSLRKRIAKALLDINAKFNKEKPGAPAIKITREDIAQYVGTATESLIRTLSDFKSEKLIEISDGKIKIINKEKLGNLVY